MDYFGAKGPVPRTYIESRQFVVDGYEYECSIEKELNAYTIEVTAPDGQHWTFERISVDVFASGTDYLHQLFATGALAELSLEH